MQGYFKTFLSMHIKKQMNGDYLKWPAQSFVILGS